MKEYREKFIAMMANFEFKSNGNQPGLETGKKPKNNDFIQCEEGPGVVAYLLTLGRLSNTTMVLYCLAGHYIPLSTLYQRTKEKRKLITCRAIFNCGS